MCGIVKFCVCVSGTGTSERNPGSEVPPNWPQSGREKNAEQKKLSDFGARESERKWVVEQVPERGFQVPASGQYTD